MAVCLEKRSIRIQIGDVLDRHCKSCPTKTEYYRKYGGASSHLDTFCAHKCPIGQQLQGLSKHLITGNREIFKEDEEMENAQEVVAAPTQKPQITKEFLESEFEKGKSASQIEREQGMKPNSIFYWMKKWGLKSPAPQSKSTKEETPKEASFRLVLPENKPSNPVAIQLSKECLNWALERIRSEIKLCQQALQYDRMLENYGESYRERTAATEKQIFRLEKYEQELSTAGKARANG